MFNALDYLIVGVFPPIIGIRFFNGVTRVTSAIIAISSASLLAAAFYRPLAGHRAWRRARLRALVHP